MFKRKIILVFFFFLLVIISCFNVSAIIDYISDPSPSDTETGISYADNVSTCVDITVPGQSCTADMYFYENSSGSWVEYENYTGIAAKATYCGNFSVECGTSYWWSVNTSFNCSGSIWWENHTYSFTTVDCYVSHVSPVNGSTTDCPCCMSLCAKFTNLTGDFVKFAFQSNYTGVWSNLEDSRVAPANTTYCLCVPEFVWYDYTYYWRIVYYDDGASISDVYHFTTESDVDNCPCGLQDTTSDAIVYYKYYDVFGLLALLLIASFISIWYLRRKKL